MFFKVIGLILISFLGFYTSGPVRNFSFEVVLLWLPWLIPSILNLLSKSPIVYIIGYIWLFISAWQIYKNGKRNYWLTNLVLVGNIVTILLRHYYAYEFSLIYHAHVLKTVPMLYFGVVWLNFQESNLTGRKHKLLITIMMACSLITAINWFDFLDRITDFDIYANLLKSYLADLLLLGDLTIVAYLWYSYAVGRARLTFFAYMRRHLMSRYWFVGLTVFGTLWIHLAML